MVPITVRRNKIVNELQKLIYNRVPRNGKMCKDKWNGTDLDSRIFLIITKVFDITHHIGNYLHKSMKGTTYFDPLINTIMM
jgi:hypothetical protein